MARPRGFDHFCESLKGLEGHYVIIGGGAAALLLDEQDQDFRATKDVDFVVLTRSNELNRRILSYIADGGYKTREATTGEPRYYRFTNPDRKECPAIIEIFTRNELGLKLENGQYIIPITHNSAESLSAILLDDEYFDLIKNNLIASSSGIPLVSAVANICLKARAYRELSERKSNGDSAISDDVISKHLKDIWRIAIILTGEERPSLAGTPAKDIAFAFQQLTSFTEAQFNQVMSGKGARHSVLMKTLKDVFALS